MNRDLGHIKVWLQMPACYTVCSVKECSLPSEHLKKHPTARINVHFPAGICNVCFHTQSRTNNPGNVIKNTVFVMSHLAACNYI